MNSSKTFELHGRKVAYDELKEYVLNYHNKDMEIPWCRYKQLLNLLPAGSRVLDYGCGWGCFSKKMADLGNEVVGIDLSSNEISICNAIWGNETTGLSFKECSIKDLPDKSFDVVVSVVVIEHTHNPGTYINEINRVLKPGGLLLIALPNVMNPRFFLPLAHPKFDAYLRKVSRRMRDGYIKATHHIQAWDPVHFTQFISTIGFSLEEFLPLEGVPMPNVLFLPRYIRGFLSRLFFLRNYCYTMAFSFRKHADSAIDFYD